MEQAIKILIAVIAMAIAIASLQNLILNGKNAFNQGANNQALLILQDKCEYTCSMNPFDSQIAVIEVSSGTVLYAEDEKICYNHSKIRCKLCSCNLTKSVILNLTSAEAQRAFDTHKYKCTIIRDQNVTINCSG